ncbi:PIN domain-containing protein [soil metagenome]
MRKVLLDTSVLVPALVQALPRHERARQHLQSALSRDAALCVAAHSLAELYAVLTRLPMSPRIGPRPARRLIDDNLAAAEIVSLETADYQSVLDRCAELNLTGGVIYDALIARAAEKAGADELLTFNVRDFNRVWPAGESVIVEA